MACLTFLLINDLDDISQKYFWKIPEQQVPTLEHRRSTAICKCETNYTVTLYQRRKKLFNSI